MTSAFHEVSFPLPLALRTQGGPERLTDIVTLASGREVRNSRWADARRRYNAGSGLRSRQDLSVLVSFFEARRGRLYGFRFRDPLDFSSADVGQALTPQDQILGTGDGSTTHFSLCKHYGDGEASVSRPIAKPVSSSVRVALGGAEVASNAFSLDSTTGILTFMTPPSQWCAGDRGFSFRCPCPL